jgi:phage/plasmid-like protein (TIGR03299 family)
MSDVSVQVRRQIRRVGRSFLGVVNVLGADRRAWAEEAGLDWHIGESETWYRADGEREYRKADKKTLYRDDTKEKLAIVSERYRPVQPAKMLEFFGDVADKHGFEMELAGEAQNGRILWGMARTPHSLELPGNDMLYNYLMLTTANDGTRATTGFFTAFRMACTNQLPLLMSGRVKRGMISNRARVTHAQDFHIESMERKVMELDTEWTNFTRTVKRLLKIRVDDHKALQYFQLVDDPNVKTITTDYTELPQASLPVKYFDTYMNSAGQEGIIGTAWGLANAVTRHLDHESRARTAQNRIASSWLGTGRVVKARAMEFGEMLGDGSFDELIKDRRVREKAAA